MSSSSVSVCSSVISNHVVGSSGTSSVSPCSVNSSVNSNVENRTVIVAIPVLSHLISSSSPALSSSLLNAKLNTQEILKTYWLNSITTKCLNLSPYIFNETIQVLKDLTILIEILKEASLACKKIRLDHSLTDRTVTKAIVLRCTLEMYEKCRSCTQVSPVDGQTKASTLKKLVEESYEDFNKTILSTAEFYLRSCPKT